MALPLVSQISFLLSASSAIFQKNDNRVVSTEIVFPSEN